MTPFLQLCIILAFILFTAKVGGYLSTRFGQSAVFGELIIGVILGPSLLDLTHLNFVTDMHLPEVVSEIGELGVLLLMFLAGLELHISDLAKNTRVSAYAGTLGVIVPVGLGLATGLVTGIPFDHAFFLGMTLGATSVSISAQVLMEMKVLRSRVGLGLLGAAVFDDVLVILLLSTVLALESGTGGLVGILSVFIKMVFFLGISVLFGIFFLPWISHFVSKRSISQGTVTSALIFLLIFSVAAEIVGGMAAITGAFLAGLMFGRTPEKQAIESSFHALAYAFFVPIFFINIGLTINIKTLGANSIWLLALLSVIAIVGKIVGAGLGARLVRFSWIESLQLGIGMVSRGEVGLIVAKVGLDEGLLTPELFSIIVGIVLVTTLVTPPMLRFAYKLKDPPVTSPPPLVTPPTEVV